MNTSYKDDALSYYSGDYGDVSDTLNDHRVQDEVELLELQSRYEHLSSFRVYGHGIVDKDGKPWDPSRCGSQISDTESNARTYVNDLNSQSHVDGRAPYRVVRLLYQEMEEVEEK